MNKGAWVFCLCLVNLALGLGSSIDPARYIWIRYNEQVPIQLNQNGQYQSKIPCESRILKCSYQYSVLPLGWRKADDGSLILKKEDVLKDGYFAVQGQFTQPTGEKLNADLVVIVKDRYLSVVDSSEYYRKIGFQNQKATGSKYQESPLIKEVPDNFPSLSEVEEKIKSGSYDIEDLIQQLVYKYAPCKSKIKYFSSVKEILLRLIESNNNKIENQKK